MCGEQPRMGSEVGKGRDMMGKEKRGEGMRMWIEVYGYHVANV